VGPDAAGIGKEIMRVSKTLIALALLLTGCAGLPRSLRQDIATEADKLRQAQQQLKRTQATIRDDLSGAPDLFNGTPAATEWPARLHAAQSKLDRADQDRARLEKLHGSGRDAVFEAERLLGDEHRLRQSALDDAAKVEGEATRWLDFRRNLPHYLAKMQQEYGQIRAFDIAPAAAAATKAGRDWPAKKPDLDSRLNAIKSMPDRAEQQWPATAAAREAAAGGRITGPQVATLVEADDVLADTAKDLAQNADELNALSGQLYFTWDKVLEDLEVSNRGSDAIYREKLKTVRTHFDDSAAKQGETSSDERWVDVSPASYRSVENDLGMAIAHKDAGLYDSEAKNIAQPAGYAYIAPPEAGSNQYGYWQHTDHGSFWTFLPQYLILRELLWGRSYQPVVVNEFNSYYSAQRAGRTWYGQETPQAAPKYGTHGTFTQQHYAGSRYMQSGGFRSSAFAGRPSSSPTPEVQRPSTQPRFGDAPDENGQGKRFGRRSDEPSQGKHFGSGGGSSQPPSGRRFGTGSGSRSPGRTFGRRR